MVGKDPGEEVFSQLEQKANEYLRTSGNCAQTSFLALKEQFGLGDGSVLKALTVFPGIALRGETCGAVVGSLMALSLVYGRDRLDDWEGFLRALRPARRFCRRFEQEYGSTMCADILKRLFGRSFNLADPAEAEEFEKSGGFEKCLAFPVGKAVRIAAEIIMEKEQ